MIFKPYYLACLSHASYLVADEGTRSAVVVDPQRDVAQYLEEAARLGVQIRHVVLTHLHADFVAGHLELAEATGAQIHVGAEARAEYPHVAARDGDRIELGSVRLTFLETPGHTPESVCVLVHDLAKDPRDPVAVLTGDTLFLGDVGRPDLMASVGVTATELASQLYDSLHDKLLRLPDSTVVWPAHGAGSLCGKSLSSEASSPLGVQRRTNYALAPMSKADFVRLVTADQPEVPSYFAFDADLNRRRRATLGASLARALAPLPIEAVLRLRDEGATLLDARGAAQFASAHLAGSLNVGLGGKYATWAGTLVDRHRPIVICADPGREEEAALRLGRIGFDHVAGTLADLHGVLVSRPELVARTRRTSPVDLLRRQAQGTAPVVVDVRGPGEWARGHVAGSVNLPLPRLRDLLGRIPRDREVVVHCETGYRSSLATSLLAQEGFQNVSDLVGGWVAYESARAPAFPEA